MNARTNRRRKRFETAASWARPFLLTRFLCGIVLVGLLVFYAAFWWLLTPLAALLNRLTRTHLIADANGLTLKRYLPRRVTRVAWPDVMRIVLHQSNYNPKRCCYKISDCNGEAHRADYANRTKSKETLDCVGLPLESCGWMARCQEQLALRRV